MQLVRRLDVGPANPAATKGDDSLPETKSVHYRLNRSGPYMEQERKAMHLCQEQGFQATCRKKTAKQLNHLVVRNLKTRRPPKRSA
eukprot:scaffold289149_cov17-Tisochrysis_lutea.AAC.1